MSENTKITINKYIPFVCIYFFLNSLFLPEGMLYTYLFTPFFLFAIVEEKRLSYFFSVVFISLIYFIIHAILGIDLAYYAVSYVLLLIVTVFCIWFYGFCRRIKSLESLFINILYINAFLIPLAIISLKFDILKKYFWYLRPISPDLPVIPRLKMFTYEASYYSLLLVPIAFFVIWKLLMLNKKLNIWHLVLVIIPLALSFSLGVISGIMISMFIVILLNLQSVVLNKRIAIISLIGLIVLTAVGFILYKYYPDNPLFTRIKNIPTGKDTSARGRTYESFDIAILMAKEKSLWFGVGLGQIKEIGRSIIMQYYQYMNMPSVVRIPNAVAETLAIYGIIGVILRFTLIIYLFFKTKVFNNYYRLSLFIFIFIYQFTGSYFFNIAEFVIWILAFSPVLSQFNKPVVLKNE